MLDFSFGEIGLVAVVALLALGPERLPKVARTAGALARRARATWQNVRDDVGREIEAADFTHGVNAAKQLADGLRREIEAAPLGLESPATDIVAAASPAEGANISVKEIGSSPAPTDTIEPQYSKHDERQ
jgi:sec-independent protein translocase protein TatB